MGTNAIVALILQATQAVMAEIAAIRGQSGQTDAQLDAQAKNLIATNDALFTALKASLGITPPAA